MNAPDEDPVLQITGGKGVGIYGLGKGVAGHFKCR